MIKREWIHAWLLLLPALVLLFGFTHLPAVQTFIDSFWSTPRGRRPSTFVGWDNYAKVFSTPAVWQAIWNTLIIAAGITIVGTLLPILPAIALLQITPDWLKRGFQTAIYTPYLLSWVIIVGIWLNTLSPVGLVNSVLEGVGLIDAPINFFADPFWARPMVIGLTVWKDVGFHALIYLAALLSLSPDILEAADIDGANDYKKIRDILLPHLMPMIKVVFLITLLGSLRTFDSAFLMLNGRTADQIRTLAIFTYERGILNFDLGLASAAGVVLLVVSLMISAFAQVVTRTEREN